MALLRVRIIAVGLGVLVLLAAFVGYVAYTRGVAVPGLGRTLRSPDGRVTLDIPWGAESQGAAVVFKTDVGAAVTLSSARGFSGLAAPVDVMIVRGELRSNQVRITLAYNPATLLNGVTPANLGLATFDAHLDAWVPILNASVDPNRHTISAIAPHFSLFSAIFLDPAKRLVSVAGKVITTVINGGVTIAKWTAEFFKDLLTALVKDLLGIAPSLACSPVSLDLSATATSLLDRVTACVQAPTADETLRIRNGFAFPLRTSPFPTGISLSYDDIFANGRDLVSLLRSAFFAILRQAILSGADLGSVTVTNAMSSSATLHLSLDKMAVAEDIVIAFVMVYAPEESVLRTGLQGMVRKLVSVGRIDPAEAGTPESMIQQLFDALDCAARSNGGGLDASPFTKKGLEELADIARNCLATMLDRFDLKSALVDLLGVVKVVPETIEASLAETLDSALPPGFHIDATSFTVTVNRADVRTIAKPFVDTWEGHSRSLIVRDDGTGTLVYRSYDTCPIPLPDAFSMCVIQETIRLGASASGVTGTVTGREVQAGASRSSLAVAAGTVYRIRSSGEILTVTMDGGDVTFCRGQAAARGVCGA